MILRHATEYDKKLAKPIYMDSFPFRERKPWFLLKKWAKEGRYDLLVARDEQGVAGLLITIPYKDMVLLDYLAVDDRCRSQGYGSKILELAEKHYEGMRLVLVAERVDEKAENNDQRVSRMKFYHKNGWEPTAMISVATSGEMEVLCKGLVSEEEYLKLNNYALGNFLFKLSKMHIVSKDSF